MSEETLLQSKVPLHQAGKTLLDFLSVRFRYQTPAAWKDLIVQGKVTVNGARSQPDRALAKGDLVAYSVILREPPVNGDIRFLHEEESFLIATKPGQLPSHADGNFIKNTFIYLVTQTLRDKGWKGDVRLVHRLDRETSGLMVVAKNREAHRILVRQFEEGTVDKEYQALAQGLVEKEKFEVKGAMGRDPQSSISVRQALVPEGTPHSKPSLTFFEKIRALSGGGATLLKCVPKTGRTNQIRVHLASTGHPLVGDKLYGRADGEFLEFIRHVKAGGDPSFGGRFGAARHMLHASRLAFTHPVTSQPVVFEAPLPPDFLKAIQDLS